MGSFRTESGQPQWDDGILEMAGQGQHLLLGNRENIFGVHTLNCVKSHPELNNPRNKMFPTACRIPFWPLVVVVKAGQRTPPEELFQEKTRRNF
jgi:hypothetical protein